MNLIKIIKKIFFFFIFSIGILNAATVSMRLLDKHKNILEQAQVKHPFIIEVKISDILGSITDPNIAGVDNFGLRKTGYQMHSINGISTIVYQYKCTIDKIGTYTIGPAEINDDGKSFFSNAITIVVGKKEKSQKNSKNLQKNNRSFVQVHLSKDRVFAGQKVRCFTTFYTVSPTVSVYDVFEPEVKGYSFYNKKGPKQGQQKINGIDYYYITWSWDLSVDVPGSYNIAGGAVDISDDRHDDFFSNFRSFLNVRGPKRRLLSNDVALHVRPLPSIDKKNNGVGHFFDFKVSADTLHANQSDGIIVTMSVKSNENLKNVLLKLEGVPTGFKVHHSKNSVKKIKKGLYLQENEFILQSVDSGKFVLPEQEFTFFDIKKEQYQTLKSKPLTFFIAPSQNEALIKKDTVSKEEKSIVEQSNISKEQVQYDLSPLNEDGMWTSMYERMIPWWVFFVLLVMPLVISTYGYVKNKIQEYLFTDNVRQRWKKAFKKAKLDIAKARKKNDISALYSIFITFFSHRCGIEMEDISMEVLSKVLISCGMKKNKLSQWESFLSVLAGARYYGEKNNIDKDKIFIESIEWIDEFKSLL